MTQHGVMQGEAGLALYHTALGPTLRWAPIVDYWNFEHVEKLGCFQNITPVMKKFHFNFKKSSEYFLKRFQDPDL